MNSGKICVSVCAETADEMITNIRRAEEFADVVEVRFDCLRSGEISNFKSQISDLKFGKPLLATFRSPEQGGKGSVTRAERIEFWRTLGSDFWAKDIEEDIFADVSGGAVSVISHHDFNGVPDNLNAIFERLAATDADVIKLAVKADDIVDAIPVWQLIERARSIEKDIIPIAMGEAGKWTRILGPAHGTFLTYASLNAGHETADGQIAANELRGVYRVTELDRQTKVFGVVGYPAGASMSPHMHNPAFAATGENAVFIALQVKELGEFVSRMVRAETREVDLNFGGFSVTMPHKQNVIGLLDAIDPVAEKIGAVNTIKIDDGKLKGFNTDAHGFITPLKERFGGLKNAKVAVFGAGGAARACVYALRQEEAEVAIYARDIDKARAFGEEFDVPADTILNFKSEISKMRNSVDIIVDTTPFGMKGSLEIETLFTAEELLGVSFVYDLVTKSTDTPLVAEAKKAGIPAIGGIEMLIAQGAMQFEIWTGRVAPVDLMRASLLARMNGL